MHELGRQTAAGCPRRMFVTDTLGNPYAEVETLGSWYAPISESRAAGQRDQAAGTDHRRDRQSALQGKSQGPRRLDRGGDTPAAKRPPLNAWMPPADWGVGAHAKHLRNLYVYFWRWATWKVFDHDPKHDTGIVCFITVAGFLNGPGFQRMRDYLRRTADAHLGDRLLARRPSARRADAHLPGRAAAGLHRAGRRGRRASRPTSRPRSSTRCCRRASAKRNSRPWPSSSSRSEAWPRSPPTGRRERRSCRRPATGPAIPPSMNCSPTTVGRHARAHVDHRAGCGIAQIALARTHSVPSRSKRKNCSSRILTRARLGDEHVQTRVVEGIAGYPTIRQPIAEGARRLSCLRFATAFVPSTASGSSRTIAYHQSTQPGTLARHLRKTGLSDSTSPNLAYLWPRADLHGINSRSRPLQRSFAAGSSPVA